MKVAQVIVVGSFVAGLFAGLPYDSHAAIQSDTKKVVSSKSIKSERSAKIQSVRKKKNSATKKSATTVKKRGQIATRNTYLNSNSAIEQHSKTQDRIKSLQSSISETTDNKHNIEAQLKNSEKEIARVRNRLKNVQSQRRKAETTLNVQLKKKAEIEAQMMHEQRLLEEINKQRIEQISQRNNPGWAAKTDPGQRMRNEMLLKLLAQKSTESIKRLEQQQKSLNRVVGQSQRTQERIKKVQEQEQKEQIRLSKERRERQRMVVKLDKELSTKALTLKRLKQDEARLAKLVSNLDMKEKREEKVNKKKLAMQKSQTEQKKTVEPKVMAQSSKAVRPVDGKVVARFGQKRTGTSGNLGSWKGLVFSVNEEKPVRAVKGGKVVFSDYLRGYGNMIIVDHGKGYFSVYGNNSSLEKDIGDVVRAGDTISRVGAKDSDLTVLYFELRHNGKPIDPTQWLKV